MSKPEQPFEKAASANQTLERMPPDLRVAHEAFCASLLGLMNMYRSAVLLSDFNPQDAAAAMMAPLCTQLGAMLAVLSQGDTDTLDRNLASLLLGLRADVTRLLKQASGNPTEH